MDRDDLPQRIGKSAPDGPTGGGAMVSAIDLELDGILGEERISTWFQPIVDIATGAVVGYEALSRGPDDSSLQMPDDLFIAAQAADRLAELDWLCRVEALQTALAIGIRPPLSLFLNIEPQVLTPAPDRAGRVLARAMGGLRVIVELTERALLANPATLLRFVETVRRYGWGLAVDDIGAHPHSLAMLSVIEPDVVKVDQPALKAMPRGTSAELVSGVQTYCRRSGAHVVAEGLETDDDVATARSFGADYGQGWWFGRATSLDRAPMATGSAVPLVSPRPNQPTQRLIHLLTREQPAQRGDRERLDRISGYLLEHATQMGPNTLVVVCVQNAEFVSPAIGALLARTADRVAYLAVVGVGEPPLQVRGAVSTPLSPADPLASEWVVAVIGLQEAIALVASDAGDDYEAGHRRRYDYAVTYDPQKVTDVSRALLSRVTGAPIPRPT